MIWGLWGIRLKFVCVCVFVCVAGRPINYIKDIRSGTDPFASGPPGPGESDG